MKIAFIGGGNMATALISGLFSSKTEIEKIHVADPSPDIRERLEAQWPLSCFQTAADAIQDMDLIVLAVKPQILPMVLAEIGSLVKSRQVVVSIVAGIPISRILQQLEASPPVVRSMPNTPALIGMGITGLYASADCSSRQRHEAENLMRAAGEIVWLDHESLLDVVTAVSGSGPAYFFYMIEALKNAGTSLGLPEEIAEKLSLHTAFGASAMAIQSDLDVAELRKRVTSKGGTTQAALEQLHSGHFENLINSAVTAAARRGEELAREAVDEKESQV
jgi:pyrroline-5-carboxylate reductase